MLRKYCLLQILLFLIVLNAVGQKLTDTIPIGGNTWVKAPALITDTGLVCWTSAQNIPKVYFRCDTAATLTLAMRIRVPQGRSTIKVSIGNKTFLKHISNHNYAVVPIGKVAIRSSGYQTISFTGISKTGSTFAEISDVFVSGRNGKLTYVKSNSSLYFGRRGPSVHLAYQLPPAYKDGASWFYSEITVPKGNDKKGSYFMADGFGEGYFGMQVNSNTERRVLFSVWSPFQTDDPKSIPDSMRVSLVKKGAQVHVGEFGDEGSGGQSYMRFNWSADKTYGFLLHAEPDSARHATVYTAWFKDEAANEWYLIASFSRPKTVTKLNHLHSFLENFMPETGDQSRMALYHNQWSANGKGEWTVVTSALFTADATAHGGYRDDYAGGAYQGAFFLRNCGFFNGKVPYGATFKREVIGPAPKIDLEKLP